MQTSEYEIPELALANLLLQTGIEGEWTAQPTDAIPDRGIDGKIVLPYNNKLFAFYVEVKRELRPPQLVKMIERQKIIENLMLVAEYIPPILKRELREEGINYLETNGNIFLKIEELWLWLELNKTEKPATGVTGRAFAKTGLRLIFHFLVDDTLVNEPYRTIAAKTGVGFGNINFIMTDLREQGFLVPINKTEYVLTKKQDLLEKWMQGYKERLKPTLEIGGFKFGDPLTYDNWDNILLEPRATWWGGEPAGGLLTNYLKPEIFTLYTTEKRIEMIRKYGLVPDKTGKVKVYEKFWHFDEETPVAPALLVYTDLMNTNDRRCIETAEKIYDTYLQDKF